MTLSYDMYPAVLYAIEKLGQGNTVSYACDLANISVKQLNDYCAANEDVHAAFVDAEQRSWDAMTDALIRIDVDKTHQQSDPKMAKVISDNIKWLAARRASKKYGERIEVKHEIGLDKTIIGALQAARRRVPDALLPPDTVEGSFTVLSEDQRLWVELFGSLNGFE